MQVKDKEMCFTIETKRQVQPQSFSFLITDPEYLLIQKLIDPTGKCYLKDHADFALGIVTGNNQRYLSRTPVPGREPVLKGCDVFRFRTAPAGQYLTFCPENFQQTAPEEKYRAPEKLLYRFICSEPVFAYDADGRLSLNSCNLVIPHLDGIKIKYILAVFNSSVVRFLYQKNFRSVKLLRSHIESFPIPEAEETVQDDIIDVVEPLIRGDACDLLETYRILDEKIFDLYQLTKEERTLIQNASPANMVFFL